MSEKDFSELLEEYQDQKGMHHFEGDSGLEKMNTLCEAIGYTGHDHKFGTPLETFLSDNPGACEAILEFISEWGDKLPEWREELISNMNESVEDED